MDNLATQILERKAIDRILEFITVELEEVTTPEQDEAAETLDESAAGEAPELGDEDSTAEQDEAGEQS